MDITISGSVTDFGGLSNRELLEYLKQKNDGVEYYQLQFEPGANKSAALDWNIIGNISSVLEIISFLWMAYCKFIKPHKKSDSNDGIIIKIKNINIENEFWIGNYINSEKELEEKIKEVLNKMEIDKQETINEINEIKNSDRWQKI